MAWMAYGRGLRIYLTDEELCRAIQSGNFQAEVVILDRYEQLAHRLSKDLFSPSFEVRDVFLIVQASVILSARTYDAGRGTKFQTWAHTNAYRDVCDQFRRARSFYGQRQKVAADPSRLTRLDALEPDHADAISSEMGTPSGYDDAELSVIILHFRESLDNVELAVFDLLAQKASARTIGRELRLPAVDVTELRTRVKSKLSAALGR